MRRSFEVGALGVRLSNDSWLSPSLRASAITLRGLVWDSRSLPAPPDDGRTFVYVVVEGRYFANGRVFEAGDAVFFPSYVSTFGSPCFASGSPHRAVALRFEGPPPEALHAARVSLETAWATHDAISRRAPEASSTIDALVRELALGDEARPRDVAPHARDDDVATALSSALGGSTGLPHLVDVALPGSSRHTRRRIDAFFDRYRMPFRHFRELRASFTLTATVLLLGRPELRLENVARIIGFSSASALCHALDRAGLPAPSLVRARFEDLRSALSWRS